MFDDNEISRLERKSNNLKFTLIGLSCAVVIVLVGFIIGASVNDCPLLFFGSIIFVGPLLIADIIILILLILSNQRRRDLGSQTDI